MKRRTFLALTGAAAVATQLPLPELWAEPTKIRVRVIGHDQSIWRGAPFGMEQFVRSGEPYSFNRIVECQACPPQHRKRMYPVHIWDLREGDVFEFIRAGHPAGPYIVTGGPIGSKLGEGSSAWSLAFRKADRAESDMVWGVR